MGLLAEFDHLLIQWQISKGYITIDTKTQLNPDNQSKNLTAPKDESQMLNNNQSIVLARQKIDINSLDTRVQNAPTSSSSMDIDEPSEPLHADENIQVRSENSMNFEEIKKPVSSLMSENFGQPFKFY